MLSGEKKKKETKKTDQKDPTNKNDLDNSERIWEVKILCKSQKIDSELSLKMVKNFWKHWKEKEHHSAQREIKDQRFWNCEISNHHL